jgi:hypothetical protein
VFKSPRPAKFYAHKCRRFSALAVSASLFAAAFLTPAPARVLAQAGGAHDIIISQVYSRGGEAGAAYQNDFIELFNRGTAPIDVNGWSLHVTSYEGTSALSTALSFVSSRGMVIGPGKHFLFRLAAGGANGQPVQSFDFDISNLRLGGTGGEIALFSKNSTFVFGVCPSLPSPDISDAVGYGSAKCYEGAAAAPAPSASTAVLRGAGGCTDTDDNAADFSLASAAPRDSSQPATLCAVGGGPTSVQFGATAYTVSEGETHLDVAVNRSGDTSGESAVDYATSDGTAIERQDYTTARGTLRFAAGETSKTLRILLTDDGYPEGGNEGFTLTLSNPSAGVQLPAPVANVTVNDNDAVTASPNPADVSTFFVRQHYHDFLNREPDQSGFVFWIQSVESCGADQQCREVKRVDASAAFFLSIEFQQTGFLVYRLYKAALPETSARPRALPRYREFIRDTQQVARGVVVGEAGWQQKLEANTAALLDEFVARPEFQAAYPAQLTPAEFVDRLNAQAGGPLSPAERDALVAGMTSGQETRASALRRVAEDADFKAAELDRAFVLMQYFGYLRRNPDEAPDASFAGYDFWLSKLDQFGGNYVQAEMVKAFITSTEYRVRFGL